MKKGGSWSEGAALPSTTPSSSSHTKRPLATRATRRGWRSARRTRTPEGSTIDPAAPPFPPVPGPVEDAPLGDPALAEPLPPLSAFDVQPVDETGAADGESDEPPPIRYTLVVEGLDAIGLEGRFRDLSALEDADNEATNGAIVTRSDLHISRSRDGELFLTSRQDGMIRMLVPDSGGAAASAASK